MECDFFFLSYLFLLPRGCFTKETRTIMHLLQEIEDWEKFTGENKAFSCRSFSKNSELPIKKTKILDNGKKSFFLFPFRNCSCEQKKRVRTLKKVSLRENGTGFMAKFLRKMSPFYDTVSGREIVRVLRHCRGRSLPEVKSPGLCIRLSHKNTKI